MKRVLLIEGLILIGFYCSVCTQNVENPWLELTWASNINEIQPLLQLPSQIPLPSAIPVHEEEFEIIPQISAPLEHQPDPPLLIWADTLMEPIEHIPINPQYPPPFLEEIPSQPLWSDNYELFDNVDLEFFMPSTEQEELYLKVSDSQHPIDNNPVETIFEPQLLYPSNLDTIYTLTEGYSLVPTRDDLYPIIPQNSFVFHALQTQDLYPQYSMIPADSLFQHQHSYGNNMILQYSINERFKQRPSKSSILDPHYPTKPITTLSRPKQQPLFSDYLESQFINELYLPPHSLKFPPKLHFHNSASINRKERKRKQSMYDKTSVVLTKLLHPYDSEDSLRNPPQLHLFKSDRTKETKKYILPGKLSVQPSLTKSQSLFQCDLKDALNHPPLLHSINSVGRKGPNKGKISHSSQKLRKQKELLSLLPLDNKPDSKSPGTRSNSKHNLRDILSSKLNEQGLINQTPDKDTNILESKPKPKQPIASGNELQQLLKAQIYNNNLRSKKESKVSGNALSSPQEGGPNDQLISPQPSDLSILKSTKNQLKDEINNTPSLNTDNLEPTQNAIETILPQNISNSLKEGKNDKETPSMNKDEMDGMQTVQKLQKAQMDNNNLRSKKESKLSGNALSSPQKGGPSDQLILPQPSDLNILKSTKNQTKDELNNTPSLNADNLEPTQNAKESILPKNISNFLKEGGNNKKTPSMNKPEMEAHKASVRSINAPA